MNNKEKILLAIALALLVFIISDYGFFILGKNSKRCCEMTPHGVETHCE